MDFLHNLSLQKGIDEWQVKQAAKALKFLYRDFLNIDLGIDPDKYRRDEGSSKSNAGSFIFKDTAISRQDIVSRYKEVFDRFRSELRILHYSLRTERSYEMWIRRFLGFHNKGPVDGCALRRLRHILTIWPRRAMWLPVPRIRPSMPSCFSMIKR